MTMPHLCQEPFLVLPQEVQWRNRAARARLRHLHDASERAHVLDCIHHAAIGRLHDQDHRDERTAIRTLHAKHEDRMPCFNVIPRTGASS